MKRWSISILVLAVTIAAVPAQAAVTFEGSNGTLAAEATFEIVGGDLQVTLTNTSTADVLEQAHVLTAVFFEVAGDPTLSADSAILTAGSTVVNVPAGHDATNPGGDVASEWAYRSDLSGDASYGISSSGLGDIFGTDHLIDPIEANNLQGPWSPDGIQYGITSASDDITTGNKAVTGGTRKNKVSLIQNSVTFTLSGLPAGFSLSDISNVSFNYGTDLGTIPGNGGVIPEPASLAVWSALAGLGLVAGFRRRKKRQANA